MAKPQEAKKEVSVTTLRPGIPEFLKEEVKADAGKGVSEDQADNLVPLIYVLDAKSPAVDEKDPRHIKGAKPGSIWLRNFVDPIVDGEVGISFQPCYFSKDWVEWVLRTRGGGFVGRYPWNADTDFGQPKEAKQVPHPENPKKTIWVLPNGNEVKETRYHAGYVFAANGVVVPYVIPMTSTGHTVSKNWMFTMLGHRTPDGKPEPSFARLYRLKTRQRTNAQGKWYVFEPNDDGYVKSVEDYRRGKDLHDAFASGAKQAEADAVAETEEADPAKQEM